MFTSVGKCVLSHCVCSERGTEALKHKIPLKASFRETGQASAPHCMQNKNLDPRAGGASLGPTAPLGATVAIVLL